MICEIKGAAPELRLALQLSPSPREGDFMAQQAPKNSQLERRCVCGVCEGCVCSAERQPTVSADKSQTKAVNLKFLCLVFVFCVRYPVNIIINEQFKYLRL